MDCLNNHSNNAGGLAAVQWGDLGYTKLSSGREEMVNFMGYCSDSHFPQTFLQGPLGQRYGGKGG